MRGLIRSFWLIPLVILVVLAVSGVARAQEANPTVTDDDVNRIAKGLYCPVCENIPLDVCGTQACQQWRDLIREKLGEGWSDEQIKTYFVNQYGDRVLAEPPRRGINWLVYLVPPLAFLLGIFILVKALRSWKAGSGVPEAEGTADAPGQPPADEYIKRLEEELRRNQ
jgi:cytochrome c-type biogenesis protein CcmH